MQEIKKTNPRNRSDPPLKVIFTPLSGYWQLLKKIPILTLKFVKEIVFFQQIYFVIQKLGYNIAR